MQKCQNCNVPFSWGKVYKSFWGLTGYQPIVCDNCGVKHKITIIGRFTVVTLTILPMLIITNNIIPYTSFISTLITGLAILFTGSMFTPFLVRFKAKQF